MKGSYYLVIRYREILCYPEYFQMYSCPNDARRDAQNLFGKPGHKLEVVPWSRATDQQKKEFKQHEKERKP